MSSSALAGSWGSLSTPLTPWILDAIQSMGFWKMTPVQAATIPLFLKHKDVVVEAVTGSGKTLAFVVPILERLIRRRDKLRKNDVGALVVSPTRELATQIHSVFCDFLAAQPSNSASNMEENDRLTALETQDIQIRHPLLLVSSVESSPSEDIQRFLETGADIVIGTPGRIEEFLLGKGKNTVNVKELEVLVLDEADRLLDMGFRSTLTRILEHLPKQRRTGLFSATMTDADVLSELVRVGLRNPARVVVKVQSKKTSTPKGVHEDSQLSRVEERRIPANLKNNCLICRPSEKLVQLVRIIGHEISVHGSSQFIVYLSTCACVDYFYRVLPVLFQHTVDLYSLHGHLPPAVRTRTLAEFASSCSTPSSPSVLLATDVAARGLDLPHVDVVIQFDPPSDPSAFSHRCGRTARAGRDGRAWVLLTEQEREYVDFLSIRKIPLIEQPYLHVEQSGSTGSSDASGEDQAVQDFMEKIRRKVLTDRSLHDKATKAYVSFVRSYFRHEASYIFRVQKLDLLGVAKSFGLLRLPRMPEIRKAERDNWEDADVDWDNYAYAQKSQEAKRLVARSALSETSKAEKDKRRLERTQQKKANLSWSQQKAKKEENERRAEKKKRKRKWLKSQQDQTEEATDANGGNGVESDDWNELAREERMAKKVRKGEASQQAFDVEFGDI